MHVQFSMVVDISIIVGRFSWLELDTSYLVRGWGIRKLQKKLNTLPSACHTLSPLLVPGGEAHSLAGKGVGKSQFPQLEKKLSTLPT